MTNHNTFDVIIVGGSYSGLAAGMALGRAMRTVLIIDSGAPCNRQTPHSHNFLTLDGIPPAEIAAKARQQVEKYETVHFYKGLATTGTKIKNGFEIQTESGEKFSAPKIIFATGIKDIMPDIPGFSECWGITAVHCPYCHGYEIRNQKTGILGNGEYGVEFSTLISNWTKDLTLYTNGKSTLSAEQTSLLKRNNINIVETEIKSLEHTNGYLQNIVFKNGTKTAIQAIYSRAPFEQHCPVPQSLGCEITEDGYIKIDAMHKTSIEGIYACGDNVTRMRTVANAVSMGTMTGIVVNKEIVFGEFK